MTTTTAPAPPAYPPAMPLRRAGCIHAETAVALPHLTWALDPASPPREPSREEAAVYAARAADPDWAWLYAGHDQDLTGPLAGVCRDCMGTGSALAPPDVADYTVPCPQGCDYRPDRPDRAVWAPPADPQEDDDTILPGTLVLPRFVPAADDTSVDLPAIGELDEHATEVLERFNALQDEQDKAEARQ